MKGIDRRRALKIVAGTALASTSALLARHSLAAAQFAPEKGAKLRVLRWKRFVQGDEDLWMRNTKKFSNLTGVDVRVDSESFEDVRPKAAVAANVGTGPDIILSFLDNPHQFPDMLVDLSDLANYLGGKYGGWYDVCKVYGMHGGRWIALPIGGPGGAVVYREGHIKAAGFDSIPKDLTGFLKLCQGLKAKGTPPGFALGNAVGDANGWCHWLIWAHGARLVDENNQVAINSDATRAALEYGKALYQTFPPGTLSWLDPSNNKAFLAGQISLTYNGISIYYSALNAAEPNIKALAADIQHAHLPVGPVGRPTESSALISPAMVFKYTKFPNAAKEYLRFMMEKEQFEPWQEASIGYVTQPLFAYENNSVWKSDPKRLAYRDAVKNMQHHGYAGTLGAASSAALADFIVVNMVAEACSGQRTPKEAAARAESRARRYYKS